MLAKATLTFIFSICAIGTFASSSAIVDPLTLVESYSTEEEIKQLSTQYLANLLCKEKSSENKHLFRQHLDGLNENYNEQFVDEIIHDALKEAWSCKQPIAILNFLYETYQGENAKSLIMMIRLQVQTFEVFVKGGNWNVRPRCGFVLHKIKRNSLYPQLAVGWRQKVDLLVKQLPTSVQYLFFSSEFCLLNDLYKEYLYTAGIIMNDNNRYVFTWKEVKPQIGTNGPITVKILDSTYEDSTDFSVQLLCPLFSTYYYIMPNSNLLAGWLLPNAPADSTWKINFIADELVTVGQSGRNICAQTNQYSTYRRYVGASNNCSPANAGQWKLGSCIRDL